MPSTPTPTEVVVSTLPAFLGDTDEEARMVEAEIAADREGTIRDEIAKHEARAAMELDLDLDLARMVSMLAAGNLTATIRNEARGHHETFRFSPRLPRGSRSRDEWDGRGWWVKLNDEARTYVGTFTLERGVQFTAASDSRPGVRYAAGLVSAALLHQQPIPPNAIGEAYTLQAAKLCGRCNRELTDPVSIERGIGPECYGKSTGSKRAK